MNRNRRPAGRLAAFLRPGAPGTERKALFIPKFIAKEMYFKYNTYGFL